MKSLLKTFMLFLASYSTCSSQVEWAPQNAKWVYSDFLVNPSSPNYITIELIGDTLIGGTLNKVLSIKNLFDCSSVEEIIYTYQTSDNKIFAKINTTDEYRMIYDFNASENDTWDIPIRIGNLEDILTYKVNEISTISENGIDRRVYLVSKTYKNNLAGFSFPTVVMIEGIGDMDFLLSWQSQDCEAGLYNGLLSCYSDINSYLINTPGDSTPCGNIVSSVQDLYTSDLKIEGTFLFPNPSAGLFTINNIDIIKEIEIFDIHGKLIIREELKTNLVDISDQPTGVYLIRLYTRDNRCIIKRIVKE